MKVLVSFLFAAGLLAAVSFVVVSSLSSYVAPSPSTVGVGVRTYARQAANQAYTSSTTLTATDLTTPIAVGQKVHIRYVVPFTLAGTAPGIKFSISAPSTPTSFNSSVVIAADDATLALVSVITAPAAQGVTLANAGNHVAYIDLDYEASVAGTIVLQAAQNVSDAAATTILKGAYAEITKL